MNRAKAQAAAVLASSADHSLEILRQVGLSKREMGADWGQVNRRLQEAIPKDRLAALATGQLSKGFGLGSDTGTGKTMAIAALIRRLADQRIMAWARELPAKASSAGQVYVHFEPPRTMPVRWLSWPSFVNWLRAHAVDPEAEDRLHAAECAPLLVLDDLGRERIKGSYIDDWAASQLDRIIDHRYREELPTIWTSNLQEPALLNLYGAALLSRLTQDAPLVWVPSLPSMRL